MNTTLSPLRCTWACCALWLALLGCSTLSAQEQELSPSLGIPPTLEANTLPTTAAPRASATRGNVLVLPNRNLIEGNIEKIENQYRIRRFGGETWVPEAHALALCESREEVYRFLLGRIDPTDANAHLLLAHWCHQHTLDDFALVEVQQALKLRPKDKRAQRLSVYLQRSKKPLPPVPNPNIVQVSAVQFAVDLTSQSLAQFGNTVQPILMNACVNCHHAGGLGGKNSSFALYRVYGPGLTQRRSTEANVAAVLKHIDLENPLQSPFLTKAISLHGGMSRAPFRNREAEPYRRLEGWVRDTIQANPQLAHVLDRKPGKLEPVEETPTLMPVGSAPRGGDAFASTNRTTPGTESLKPTSARTVPVTPSTPSAEQGPVRSVPRTTSPETTPTTQDPFDPGQFNRQMHPEGKPGTPQPVEQLPELKTPPS